MSALAELAGLACLVVAAALLCPVAGWAVAGVCLLLVGQALDGVDLYGAAGRALARVGRVRLRRVTR